MSELRGVNVRQQIEDADNWVEGKLKNLLRDGWEGLMLENGGNFKSSTLN